VTLVADPHGLWITVSVRALVVVMGLAACAHDPPRTATPDPWAAPAAVSDDPPDFGTVHALADKACPRVTRPYFFRVERAGAVSYFLGTRHIGVPLAKLPAGVTRQLRAAKLVVFETPPDTDDESTADTPGEVPLPELLGPELWARYRKLVGTAAADALAHARPSAALITMTAVYEDKLAMLDVEIADLVRGAHIPTQGLETHAFQDALIEELMDVRMLRATVRTTPDRGALEREALRDLAEYCAGRDHDPGTDARTRKQLHAGGFSDTDIARLDDKLVFARNRDWIPKLEPLLAGGGVVVVVGADHLIGPRGVLAMLAARGWKTTRVTQP